MTENEAKTKLCHQTIDGDGACPVNVQNTDYACIASACMAWRWINPDSEAPDGYCGLAGRP